MWTNVSIIVNKYTSRNLTEAFVEAPWNIMKHPGTLWNMIEHGRTSWNIIEHHGTSWNLVEFGKNIMESFGQNWNLAGTT